MVSSFSKVAVAAFTSFVSHPSSLLRRFGLGNYRHYQYRCLHSPKFSNLHYIGNAGTIPSNRRKNVRSSSTSRSCQNETTVASSSSVSSSSSQPQSRSSSYSAMVSNSECKTIRAQKSLAKLILASRPGLDPSLNRFHAPLVYHDGYSSVPDWPPKHTFPMMKFERTSHALLTTTSKTVATSNLPRPIVRSEEDYFRPPDFSKIPIEEWLDLLNHSNNDSNNNDGDNDNTSDDDSTNVEIVRPETTDFHHRFLRGELTIEEARMIGFREQTHRPELVERTVLEVAGTVLTAQLALKYGIASNLAGGTHHAYPNGGAGYTILNDLAITTNLLTTSSLTTTTRNNHDDSTTSLWNDSQPNQKNAMESDNQHTSGRVVDRVLVIDCDVHQGDGTAQYSTLWKNDGRLFTLSIHCESNYPFLKQNSTYDVGLPDHCNDHDYLIALKDSVNRAIQEVRPDLVLYDAGVDVYKHDTLGRLDLTEEDGIRQRDRWVLDRCVSSGIPVAAVVGGGYDKDIDALGRRHAIVHEECAYVWRKHKLWKRFQNVAGTIRG